jgi:hypothetical protein
MSGTIISNTFSHTVFSKSVSLENMINQRHPGPRRSAAEPRGDERLDVISVAQRLQAPDPLGRVIVADGSWWSHHADLLVSMIRQDGAG